MQIWTLPYRRNAFFTGREAVLERIHAFLQAQLAVYVSQPAAISGLGGIGKTQIAIEYAYRYGQEYQYVLWVQADTHDTLTGDFVALAHQLNLSQHDAQDLTLAVEDVKAWLAQHSGWLLIFDNADDLALVDAFLPTRLRGHVLFTTRTQLIGGRAVRVDMEEMNEEEGVRFLLRRSGMLAPDASLSEVPAALRMVATTLVNALDGLPLALDQAGAYIEETGCGLPHYLDLYQTQRKVLLARRSKRPSSEHPQPVATTWSLSFERIQQQSPAAAEVLRCCAFLHPDAIPEEVLTAGGSPVSPELEEVAADPLHFDEAISELLNYSLLRRLPDTHSLSMHRLVQAVLIDAMDPSTQQRWAEHIVQMVDQLFPFSEVATWEVCQRYLPHAMQCADSIEQWGIDSREAAQLLFNVASYLNDRAQYPQAELLYQRALAIKERLLGSEHLDIADTLNNLANLYFHQGRYEQAEPLHQRALAIKEQLLVPEHPSTADTLNNLAALYFHQGRYEQAELLYQRAMVISERVLGPEHPETANTLENLASLYSEQGRDEQAEPLYQRSLTIKEQVLGPEHPSTAGTLNNLAILYKNLEKYEQAEPLYQRALAIREQMLGSEHPETAGTLTNLATLYFHQGRYEQAEPLFQRALAIYERLLGPEHPHTAITLNNLAALYLGQGRYEQAEPLYQRALAIYERLLVPEHPDTANTLNNLASLYAHQGKHEQAELLYQRSLAIKEQVLGPEHPSTIRTLENYADLLREGKRDEEAARLEAEIEARTAKRRGSE